MKKTLAFFALLFYCLFSLMLTASALVQKSSSFYVADYANVISSSTEQMIIATNAKLEKLTRGQIVVVTVESLSGYKSSEYAAKLMNDWGVGDAKLNNGMLLLLAPKEKKGWLIQGSGIANVFTSSKINALLDKYFWPDVDKGKYDSAVSSTFRQMINWYEGYYNVSIPISASSGSTISSPAATNSYYGGSQAVSGGSGSSYGSSSGSTYAGSGSLPYNNAGSVSSSYSPQDSFTFGLGIIFFIFIILAVITAVCSQGRRRSGGYYNGPTRRGPGFGSGFVGGYMVGNSMRNRSEDEERDSGSGFGSGFGGQSSGGGGGRDDDDNSSGFGSGFGGHSSDGGGGRDDDNSGFGGFSSGGGGGSYDSGSSFSDSGSSFSGGSSDGGGFSGGGGGGRD